MAARAVTEGDLGAWLLKCDPRVNPELLTTAGTGVVRVTSRCVVPGYRAAMMQEGDRVLLWVSGDGRRMARGIWGLGRVTGVVDQTADRPAVPVDIPLFPSALADADLRVAGIDDLEVQRMPAGSNPSWVSRQQWADIEPLLGAAHRS
ncbi:EVE domain-containing protein [Nocardioides panacis]|uniref:EVE domain-containing protein n=1 Tax=Nocardioides panacis TaxID=2849501 RepID=A0A975T1H8_9ACTN|nr:EVE domain-containing protein [Nocardioides panacis]QWZ09895.1 EVE domain-containing protein [Nocardioides panacis]